MTAYSIGPAWTEITYTTPFGTHVQNLPTVPYDESESFIRGALWLDLRGAAGSTAWAASADDYAEQLIKMLPSTCVITQMLACDYDVNGIRRVREVSPNTPFVGTDNLSGFPVSWAKATQRTMSFRCEDGSSLRIMLFDVPARDFNKASGSAGLPVGWTDYITYVTGVFSFVASRKGGRPINITQIATTLNDNLRRKYGMN